jgi:hypothetical protein
VRACEAQNKAARTVTGIFCGAGAAAAMAAARGGGAAAARGARDARRTREGFEARPATTQKENSEKRYWTVPE